ncbi:hypothetical protein Ga0466249_005052 [Sporomusaceae bacterium BoRhaA]|uniref:VRR-NUC domain-containing protein n=1 Tax=Pelorhabdus rhamnosifermentans TaxID=2772457 RepID=UPI001C0605EB|nr:VRR-NUC domain-containing protein [Pelorhabdus rhamnosifermentans]MBU2703902.1 hypothetical protein [Pelorhabdus rhamnosifermentans]
MKIENDIRSEHSIQNEIQVAISENNLGTPFRINVGFAWTGNKIIHNGDGSKTIKDPRPFATFGAQTKQYKGFSDVFVVMPTVITPDMVGQKIARIGFLEIKTKTGRPTKEQLDFISLMQSKGASAGVARSVEDAIQILSER